MDICERCYKTILPDKKEFYSSLNMEYITDAYYKYSKKV